MIVMMILFDEKETSYEIQQQISLGNKMMAYYIYNYIIIYIYIDNKKVISFLILYLLVSSLTIYSLKSNLITEIHQRLFEVEEQQHI